MKTFTALLLCLAALATAALEIAPHGRHNVSGCVTMSRTSSMTTDRALVGLYLGGRSVLLEDISDALAELWATAASVGEEENEEQDWQLCVDYVSSTPLVGATDGDPIPSTHDLVMRELPHHNPVPELSAVSSARPRDTTSEIVLQIQVDSIVDSVANVSACAASSAAGLCNFRSAVAHCEWTLSEQTGSSCLVDLPPAVTIFMDPTLGEMAVSAPGISGHLRINGNGCIVQSAPDSSVSARLLSANATSSLGLSMSNMSVDGFGGKYINGGSISCAGLDFVDFYSVSFTNSRGSLGGALYFTNCDGITIAGCFFTDSTVVLDGGCVCLDRNNTNVAISDSVFVATSAGWYGGSIYLNQHNDYVTLSQCTFTDTSSGTDGGSIYIGVDNYDITISDCNFTDTSAGFYGGSISLDQDNDVVDVVDCSFVETTAAYYGGTIYLGQYNDGVSVTRCTFSLTSADNLGGSIYVYRYNHDFSLSDSTFTGTRALDDGGSIFLSQFNHRIVISNCNFVDSSAESQGGSMYIHQGNSDMLISECVFSGTSAENDGGAIYINRNNDRLSIYACVFTATISGADGGSIFLYQENLLFGVSDSVFTDSSAGHNGGSIYALQFNDLLAVSGCTFTRTSANAEGGSIYMYLHNNLAMIADCTFTDTSTFWYGGSISLNNENSDAVISNCTFTNTTSDWFGGSISLYQSNAGVTVSDCTFNEVSATWNGGSIYLHQFNNDFFISHCKFIDTSAGYYGGAMYLFNGNIDFLASDCVYINSTSAGYGGALFIEESNERASILNSTFSATSAASEGGSILVYRFNDLVSISGCVFFETFAGYYGGSIYMHNNNYGMAISNSTFTSTSAGWFGGSIYSYSSSSGLVVTDCTFSMTSAAINGGSIYLEESNTLARISRCIFNGTTAWTNGASIYISTDNGPMAISGCTFAGNSAGTDGGAIYIEKNNQIVGISDCTFIGTSAGNNGGSIYLYQDNDAIVIISCTFAATSADHDGGSIYLYNDNDDLIVSNCSFADTYAGNNGGSIHLYSANLDGAVVNCTFTDTRAEASGGAVLIYVNNNGFSIVSSSFYLGFSYDGGALYIGNDNNKIIFEDVLFRINIGFTSGGAVYSLSGNSGMQFTRCVFDGNYGSASGGAVTSMNTNAGMVFEKCMFRENFASSGGGIYVGPNHENVWIIDTYLLDNIADFGAGLYLEQFSGTVTFNGTIISRNTAVVEGGGIYALTDTLFIVNSFMFNNTAQSSGALFSRTAVVRISLTIVSGNKATTVGASFGGMYFESALSVAISATQYVANTAGSGGAIGATGCGEVSIHGCRFEDNTSVKKDGGAILSVNSYLNISSCEFTRNTAHADGGAIHLTVAGGPVISNCDFRSNNASTGSGSAIWMASSVNASIVNNALSDNHAVNGGGTIYWIVSTMKEPLNLFSSNDFVDTNTALYGNSVATDPWEIVPAVTNNYHVTDYTAPVPPVVAHLIDYYDQIVRTESNAILVASVNSAEAFCYKSTGYVTSGIIETNDGGVANFTALSAYCDPGYSMTVYLTALSDDATFQTSFELSFRECVTGEYWGDRTCIPCNEGTFSVTDPATVSSLSELTQLNVCLECPEGAEFCYGDTMTLEKGYWRISELATRTTKCPYSGSCGGGSGTGDALCTDGYEGPVCAVCADGYSFRSSTQQCEPCSDSAGLDAITILFIVLVALVCLLAVYVYSNPNFRERVKTLDDFYVFVFEKLRLLDDSSTGGWNNRKEEASVLRRSFQARLKFYIIVWQVVSLLPFTLDMNFPHVYTGLASVLSFFNLSVDASSLVTCAGATTFDAIDKLVFETVYPIVVTVLLYVGRTIHLAMLGDKTPDSVSRISSRYFSIFLVFTYLILPYVSVVIFQTFSCQDVDPGDVEPGNDSYMTVDYSVSCSSSNYHFGFIWAILSLLVYPVGIPLFYFYLLYGSRHEISNRHSSVLSPTDAINDDDRLRSKKLLFEFYAPRFWFWEVVETVHRLLLTGVLVIIAQGTGTQVIVGVTVALFFLKLIDVYQPYEDPNVQRIRVMCQWQIYFVFFLALIMKADFDSVDRGALDGLLILTIIASIINDTLRIVVRVVLRKGSADTEPSLNSRTVNPLSALDEKEDHGAVHKEIAMSDFGTGGEQ